MTSFRGPELGMRRLALLHWASMAVFPLLLIAGIALLGVLAVAALIVIVVRAGSERV